VQPSTLSRLDTLDAVERGRERRLRPREVLRLAAYYRKRPLYEVGGRLIQRALCDAPDWLDEVGAEVDAFLDGAPETRDSVLEPGAFLAEAKRALPPGAGARSGQRR